MPTEYPRIFSFELFPPKTEKGFANMQQTVKTLQALNPAYFSVTYGAGGSTRQRTFDTVDWLRSQGVVAAPHISCVGSSRKETIEILERYRDQGIERVVALRGDLPSGVGLGGLGELRNANQLVELIRDNFADRFHIEVAAYPEFHPQATSARQDMAYFKQKVEAGANGAITQYFYNPDAYFRFVDDCRAMGIEIPIVPGIMPINNFTQLARFSDACGAEIPRWLRKRLEDFGEDLESIRAYGIETVTRLCQRLLDGGAPGIHFYTMNQAGPSKTIWENLRL